MIELPHLYLQTLLLFHNMHDGRVVIKPMSLQMGSKIYILRKEIRLARKQNISVFLFFST